MKINFTPSTPVSTYRKPGETQTSKPVPQDGFKPSPGKPVLMPRIIGAVAAAGAGALGYFAGTSGSVLGGVASGLVAGGLGLGIVGLVADLFGGGMLNNSNYTGKAATFGAVAGAVVGGCFGAAFASPLAGAALGLAAALPTYLAVSLVAANRSSN